MLKIDPEPCTPYSRHILYNLTLVLNKDLSPLLSAMIVIVFSVTVFTVWFILIGDRHI